MHVNLFFGNIFLGAISRDKLHLNSSRLQSIFMVKDVYFS